MTTIDRIKRLHPGISDQHAKDAAMVVDAIQEAIGDTELKSGLLNDAVFAFWARGQVYIHHDFAAIFYKASGTNYRSRVYCKPTPEWAKVFAEIARLVKEDGR